MHQSVLFVDNRLLSVHLQRQGLCFENASQAQHCCASGLGRCATSIGAVRRQGGSAHAYHSGERPPRFSDVSSSNCPMAFGKRPNGWGGETEGRLASMS